MAYTLKLVIEDWLYEATLKDKVNKTGAIKEALFRTFCNKKENAKALIECYTRNLYNGNNYNLGVI